MQMCQDALINSSRSFYQNIKDFFKKLFIFLKKSCQVFRQLFSAIFSQKKKNGCVFLHTHLNMIKIVLLLGNNQVVVLLTALNEQVFFIEQVGSSNYLIESSKLFLVQRNTTTLNELTHFAF